MGKSKKHKKEKKKKSKKHRKQSSSSSEEVWVEKKISPSSSSDEEYITTESSNNRKPSSPSSEEEEERVQNKRKIGEYEKDGSDNKEKRDDWMNLPTSFLTTCNSNRRRERDEAKIMEREKQQYDPRKCSRELNPYWKDGGDGLPKFKKPNYDDEVSSYSKMDYRNRTSNWKKTEVQKTSTSDSSKQYCVNNSAKSTTNQENTNRDVMVLSEKELNLLAAKLVKAEIMGNTKLVNELKTKLEEARNAHKSSQSSETKMEEVLLVHTDAQGRSQPLKQNSDFEEASGSRKRKKNVETHKDGRRVKYFADDDKYSLKQMFEKEKYNSVEDQNKEFVTMASKIRKNDDLDDIFTDNIRKEESDSKIDSKRRNKAINEHQKVAKSLDNCNQCIQSEMMLKHLMVTMKETSYVSLPAHEPLTVGHCFIVPIRHVPCSTQLDENEWSEILDIRKTLVKIFKSKNEEVIFFETAISLHRFPHMFVECIPMPKEEGYMAPIYFKKAIDESESEWAHNKKLISLKGRDVRKAIPKGLPYFSVSFGMEEGFAHVIEDEQLFPRNFAQEIIGGMLDAHHSKWRKPKRQSFEEQSKRVLAFSKDWNEFDTN